MKKSLYAFIVLSFILFSCGESSEQTTESNDDQTITEQKGEATTTDFADCDEFLDNYEKWVDDYLTVLEAYMEDPTNIQISQEYLLLAQNSGTWLTEWTEYASCAAQGKYEKRFDAISDKIDKKMEELGLDE
jgi:sulfite reductase alpha subunit-like flavoprotein